MRFHDIKYATWSILLTRLIIRREVRRVSSLRNPTVTATKSMKSYETCTDDAIVSSQDTFDRNFMWKLNVLNSIWNCVMRLYTESDSFISFHRRHDNIGNTAMKPCMSHTLHVTLWSCLVCWWTNFGVSH
jgi:hypothetical protein